MKKFASLVLSVVILAAMLCVFAVPASAEDWNEDLTLSGTKTFDEGIDACCNVTVERNSSVTFTGNFALRSRYTLTVKSGATVIFNQTVRIFEGAVLILEDGASVICDGEVFLDGGVTIEGIGTVTCKGELQISGSDPVTVKNTSIICDSDVFISGVTVKVENSVSFTCNGIFTVSLNSTINVEAGAKLTVDVDDWYGSECAFNIHGIMTGCFEGRDTPNIHIFPGGTLDMIFKNMSTADLFEQLEAECTTAKCEDSPRGGEFHITAHKHIFAEKGICCGQEVLYGTDDTTPAVGSTLSEGSLTVICSVAGVAVGFLAAMFIFKKKKKTAVADGTENKGEE